MGLKEQYGLTDVDDSLPVKDVDVYVSRGPRIRNISDINQLYLLGVRRIVCLEEGWHAMIGGYNYFAEARERGMLVMHIRTSNFFPPSIGELWAASEFAQDGAVRGHRTYIHCFAGVDRTGCAVAAYEVRAHQRSPESAWADCLKAGFHQGRYFYWKKPVMAALHELARMEGL